MSFKSESPFNYDSLIRLRKNHPAWKLLCLDNSPLILSFLHKVFVDNNQRIIAYPELVTKLDDYLFFLRSVYGKELYPRKAKDYIEDWAGESNAFLRVYYVLNSDDPEVDLTPAVDKVFEWIESLEQKSFIGTESRLLHFFQLIREMVNNTEQNAELRLAELEQQKQNIEFEIAKVKQGIVATYDKRQVSERFTQIEETAQSIISDFRQVEHNFRTLDREMRERIAISDKNKGGLLDEIFQEQDFIRNSDQGRSFRGFWEYLMSPERQEEMKYMLDKIFCLPDIERRRNLLEDIDIHLLDVGQRVYRSYNLIAEQLRKYLDNQSYLEQRRITELIKSIERSVVENKDDELMQKISMELTDIKPEIEMIMSKPLFTPPRNPVIADNILEQGVADSGLELLFRQYGIDENVLYARVKKMLQLEAQVSLKQIIATNPLEYGLAEVITYMHLATKNGKAFIDNEAPIDIVWTTEEGKKRQMHLPNVIFVR